MNKCCFLIPLLAFFVLSSNAQVKDGAVTLPESFPFGQIKISEYTITGDQLTKEWYIIRELDFKIGDTLSTQKGGGKTDFEKEQIRRGRFQRAQPSYDLQPGKYHQY